MRYLLSIHDVWPGNAAVVEDHWQKLRSLGMGAAALLVVPEYHGGRPIEAEQDFLAWLAGKRAAGSEIFLHGFRHCMAERVAGAGFAGKRSAWGRWVNRRFVNHEAEFLGLPKAERERLLEAGIKSFEGAGLPRLGFVAPTWHGAPPKSRLRSGGFRYFETRFRLHDLASGRSRFAPPLAWDQRRGGADLFGGGAWLSAALRLPLLKVAIHPGDFSGSGVTPVLERVVRAGRASSYAEIFN